MELGDWVVEVRTGEERTEDGRSFRMAGNWRALNV